jgi:hypothetical protein
MPVRLELGVETRGLRLRRDRAVAQCPRCPEHTGDHETLTAGCAADPGSIVGVIARGQVVRTLAVGAARGWRCPRCARGRRARRGHPSCDCRGHARPESLATIGSTIGKRQDVNVAMRPRSRAHPIIRTCRPAPDHTPHIPQRRSGGPRPHRLHSRSSSSSARTGVDDRSTRHPVGSASDPRRPAGCSSGTPFGCCSRVAVRSYRTLGCAAGLPRGSSGPVAISSPSPPIRLSRPRSRARRCIPGRPLPPSTPCGRRMRSDGWSSPVAWRCPLGTRGPSRAPAHARLDQEAAACRGPGHGAQATAPAPDRLARDGSIAGRGWCRRSGLSHDRGRRTSGLAPPARHPTSASAGGGARRSSHPRRRSCESLHRAFKRR